MENDDLALADYFPAEARELAALGEHVTALEAELGHYRAMFGAAAAGPVGRQVLGMLGIKPSDLQPPQQPDPG